MNAAVLVKAYRFEHVWFTMVSHLPPGDSGTGNQLTSLSGKRRKKLQTKWQDVAAIAGRKICGGQENPDTVAVLGEGSSGAQL